MPRPHLGKLAAPGACAKLCTSRGPNKQHTAPQKGPNKRSSAPQKDPNKQLLLISTHFHALRDGHECENLIEATGTYRVACSWGTATTATTAASATSVAFGAVARHVACTRAGGCGRGTRVRERGAGGGVHGVGPRRGRGVRSGYQGL